MQHALYIMYIASGVFAAGWIGKQEDFVDASVLNHQSVAEAYMCCL